jgi:hypothetical protein
MLALEGSRWVLLPHSPGEPGAPSGFLLATGVESTWLELPARWAEGAGGSSDAVLTVRRLQLPHAVHVQWATQGCEGLCCVGLQEAHRERTPAPGCFP